MAILGYRKSGDCEFWVIGAGVVKMDGGAMFGVVPKPLWEKRLPADENNRVLLGMNCLLVRFGKTCVLVETGFGGKLSEKLKGIYALDESDGVMGSLQEIGIAPEEISMVVLTHLHQDHAGGCTVWNGEKYVPTFLQARYYVQRGEWADAELADDQTVNGYRLKEVMLPLLNAGVVQFLDGDSTLCEKIRVIQTPGHTRCHQSVLIETGGETVCFVGDIIPTTHHLRPIYVMAYDLFPRDTFLNKQKLMAQAHSGNWIMVWGHDLDWPWSRLAMGEADDFVPVDI